jgi:hypothetical protein
MSKVIKIEALKNFTTIHVRQTKISLKVIQPKFNAKESD